MRNARVTIIVEIALAIALSAVLGMIAPVQLPQGGSFSLVMLPVIVLAIRRGAGVGIIAGVLYGVLDASLQPHLYHWAQAIIDYPLAFGAIGLAGILSARWRNAVSERQAARAVWTVVIPAVLVGAGARFLFHVASGVIFFGEYAPEGQPVLLYSAIYNASYMVPSALACAAAAMILLPALRNVGSIAVASERTQ